MIEIQDGAVEELRITTFGVKAENEHVVLGHIFGGTRMYSIRIPPGDKVKVELTPYDLTRARTVCRAK